MPGFSHRIGGSVWLGFPKSERSSEARSGVSRPFGLVLVTALAATGCSGDDGPSIVVYNAQHEQLLEEIAPKFTEKTGIEVELRNGSDPSSPTSWSRRATPRRRTSSSPRTPRRCLVERAGLFAPLDEARSSRSRRSTGRTSGTVDRFAARSTVLVYNPSLVDEAELPASILDLADPE